MRGVNDLIWESLDHGGHTDLVAFFCECGQEGCYRPVWLTLVEYEQNRRSRLGAEADQPHRLKYKPLLRS